MIYVGNDWAEGHHDVHVMDESGNKLAKRRLAEGVAGISGFHELVSGVGVDDPGEVVVGIETDRGLWVNALVGAGYQVYAVNPQQAARYRQRHSVGGAKSDAGDAKLLADLVRTDAHNHRRIAGDTPQVEAVQVLARAHQNLIWSRTRETNRLRSSLRQYYPAALAAFDGLADPDALAVLGAAPDPESGARLSLATIRAVLRKAGRRRYLDQTATLIQQNLRSEQLTAPPTVVAAYAATTRATIGLLTAFNTQIADLETRLQQSFEQHPDAVIYLSLPGLGDVLGARVLGEFGDAPERFADAKSRRNYAGTSPITRASGTKRVVLARWVRNKRLYDAIDQWAFCALSNSPGARRYYDQHRQTGQGHHQALRALGNRLVGILHGCLKHHTPYNEQTAWQQQTQQNQTAA